MVKNLHALIGSEKKYISKSFFLRRKKSRYFVIVKSGPKDSFFDAESAKNTIAALNCVFK